MRYTQIAVLITAFFILFLSCRETIGEQHDSLPKDNSAVPSEKKKLKTPTETKDGNSPIQTPPDKEIKKKKMKASDTLKPKMAVL